MSENKAVSILVALVFRTALIYFRYLPIILNFFFSLVWICGIMLGRNTNFPLVQQILLVPQLPQSSFFIFFTVSEWHQLVLTQKSNPMGSTTEASQSSNGWGGTSSATGVQWVPPVAHPALQLSTPKASESISVPQWHLLHSPTCSSDPPEEGLDCWRDVEWQHMALSILWWKPPVDGLQ